MVGPDRPRLPPAKRLRSFSPWHGSVPTTTEVGILVVDPQRVSQRFIELALSSGVDVTFKASTECAGDAASAFEILKTKVVDAIFSEVDLPDMSGLRFCRLLRQEGRFRDIPLIFLSADDRVGTRVVALRAGADDYIVKPCDPAELSARLSVAISRRLRAVARMRSRHHTLGGDFTTLTLPDLVSILEVARRTGVLSIVTPRAMGEILFEGGRVVHASFANLSGVDAFYRLMDEHHGQFEFTAQEMLVSVPHSIDDSVPALLMEAARRMDEREAAHPAKEEVSSPLRGLTRMQPSVVHIGERPVSALVASNTLSAQFELAIADELALGELMFLDEQALLDWTMAEVGQARLHVHVFADLSTGVSAILSMASPPGERSIHSALQAGQKQLALAFFLRQELLVDLILFDIRQPIACLGSMRRSPAITLIAPHEGDPLALGPTALVAFDTLVRHLSPSTLVWVTRRKADSLAGWPSLPTLHIPGALDDPTADLRSLVVEGVRFWSKAEAARQPKKLA